MNKLKKRGPFNVVDNPDIKCSYCNKRHIRLTFLSTYLENDKGVYYRFFCSGKYWHSSHWQRSTCLDQYLQQVDLSKYETINIYLNHINSNKLEGETGLYTLYLHYCLKPFYLKCRCLLNKCIDCLLFKTEISLMEQKFQFENLNKYFQDNKAKIISECVENDIVYIADKHIRIAQSHTY